MKRQLDERFMKYVAPEPNSGCWLWAGTLDSSGYGLIWDGKTNKKAHRISHELLKGPIPPRMEIDHKCRVRCCVNPDHLEVVTHRENFMRGLPFKKRKIECPHGHAYTPENSKLRKNGSRVCRECDRLRSQTHNWRSRGVPVRQMTER
jgi:hypothetical protein